MEAGSNNSTNRSKDFDLTAIATATATIGGLGGTRRLSLGVYRNRCKTGLTHWGLLLLLFVIIMSGIHTGSATSYKANVGKVGSPAESTDEEDRTPLYAVQAGIADFSHSFYQALRREHVGNLISSPYSLSVVMAMLKIACKGISAREIENAMRYPKDNDIIREGFAQLLSAPVKNLGAEDSDEAFTKANKIFVQQGQSLNTDFSSTLKTYFNSAVQQLNFDDSSGSAEIINNWISEQTRNKISQLFGPDAFTPLTRIVLVSAIHLKGKWLHKFNPKNTEKMPFFTNEEESFPVDMMMQNGESKFLYAEIDYLDAKILSLPFKSDNLSMLILLPNKITGLKELEAKLTHSSIVKHCSLLQPSLVEIYLPKFTLESTLNLKDALIALGIPSIFDAELSDLGGIFEGDVQELEVAEVVQKSIIEVNEEGAEAAAATGVKIRTRRSAPMSETFNANHPFLFAILQGPREDLLNSKASVIFYGSLVNPTDHSKSTKSSKDEL